MQPAQEVKQGLVGHEAFFFFFLFSMKTKAIYSSLVIIDLHIMQEMGNFCMYCVVQIST
jgi:hypothetical protein